jgi:hypothetical protein
MEALGRLAPRRSRRRAFNRSGSRSKRSYFRSPEQVELMRKPFDALWPMRRRLADAFYNRFYELAPDARPLFPDDLERQQR